MPTLSEDKIFKIQELAKTSASYAEIAKKVGCSASTAKKYALRIRTLPSTDNEIIEAKPIEEISVVPQEAKFYLCPHKMWPPGTYYMSCSPKMDIQYCSNLFGLSVEDYVKYCKKTFSARTLNDNSDHAVFMFYCKEDCERLINELNRRQNFICTIDTFFDSL